MNEGDGQIAQGGHELRSRARAQAGAIFAKGGIPHIMQAVLNAPMTTHQIEEVSRTGLDLGEVGDEVDYLLGRLAGLAHRHGARQASHLTHQRPSGSQIVVHATTDLDGAGLDASSMPIDGAVLLIERNDRVGIGEIGGQIRREGRLIAFDRQHTGPAVRMSDRHKVGVGMQSISGVDARTQRQTGQDLLSDGDLIGFFRDAHLEQRFLTLMGTERKQVGSLVRGGGRSAHGFAEPNQ